MAYSHVPTEAKRDSANVLVIYLMTLSLLGNDFTNLTTGDTRDVWHHPTPDKNNKQLTADV